ncbi:MAG: LON peptidase substrate-binding domain-containing protein [Ilumatobacteraceae bacterium]|nr:LON peptidase substrate-binding domain-containing protein [Ilumatobacteraceae bacterium]
MPVMPMFPLGSVLLPGGVMPLHVFEPRYRQMVIDCLLQDGVPEFGQVLISHGSEAGGGDDRELVGTVAAMQQLNALDSRRYAFNAVGTRRIRVIEWLDDDPYPVAEVDDWPDVTCDANEVAQPIAEAERRVRAALSMAQQLDMVEFDPTEIVIQDEPIAASYQLAAMAPIGPADRFRLLAAAGPQERLAMLAEILEDVEAMLKFRLS